jgi:hypothetical protein
MRTWLRVVLIIASVGGGFAGVLGALPLVFHSTVSHALLAACAVAVYTFITASGVLFALDEARTGWLFPAFILQIPYVSFSLFTYKFAAGAVAFLITGGQEGAGRMGIYGGTELALASSWKLGFGEDVPMRLGVNFFAVGMLVLLNKSRKGL